MAKIDNWRVISIGDKQILVALDVEGHPFIEHGPIITSVIVSGKFETGEIVITKSGTNYMLGTKLPADQDCEFARPYLIARASRNLQKYGQNLKLEQLDELNRVIDKVLGIEAQH